MSRYRPAVVGILAVAVLLSTGWADAPAYAENDIAPVPAGSEAPVDEGPTEEPTTIGDDPVVVPTDPVVVPPADDPVVAEIVTEDPDAVPAPDDLPVADSTAPGAPGSPSATAGDGSAVVRWTRPTTNGGATIHAFIVRAAPSGKVVKVPGDRTSAKVTGLRNGEATTFKVAARNVIGSGAVSRSTDPVTPRAIATFKVERQPSRRVVYGTRSTVRVVLVAAGGVGVPNQRVNLLARVSRSSRWRSVDSDVTGSRGRVTLGTTLRRSAALRVRHPTGSFVARDAAVRSVVVAKRVSAWVTGTRTRLGQEVIVRGRVSPRQRPGSPVVLQRRVDGAWQRVAVGHMTTQRRYVTRWKPARVGGYALRVRKAGSSGLAEGVSQAWRHRVDPETAADVAADILGDRDITLATVHVSSGSDGATAKRNIVDVANGREAKTSQGSSTPLDLRMLRAVREMGQRGTLTVSEFAGGNHASGSDHYRGRGVDITWVNGRHVGYGSGYDMAVTMCRKYGASEIFSPANDPWGGHHNHVHCGWSKP